MALNRPPRPYHPFTVLVLLASLIVSSSFTPAPFGAWQSKVDPALLAQPAESEHEFLVFLSRQADLSGAARLSSKAEKGLYVYQRLRETANQSQPAVLAALKNLGVEARPFWVANMIWVRGNLRVVQALAQRLDVSRVYANPAVRFQEPDREGTLLARQSAQAAAGPEWNLKQVNAPAVWDTGITGQGVVIGGQDTGYDWEHPALREKYRGWDGTRADHNYNWHDAVHSDGAPGCPENSPAPCDDNGHGTHTMGIMVGDDGAGNQVGMAPGAKWIGCRNMNRGVGSPATYTECYQWFLAPTDLSGGNERPDLAPHVINNSWACPLSEGCTEPDVLLEVVKNVRAAGILTVHSAGNEGSACGSIGTAAAIYDESFTVGNTTNLDQISNSSSRGPVTVDGSGRRKPDISAPGSGIRSAVPAARFNEASYWTMSGTSMAGPHVAGLAALLISANPALGRQVDLLEAVIEQTALPLTSGESCGDKDGQVPNNTYGWGRIDAWNALQSLHRLSVMKTVSAAQIEPGGVLTYTLQVSHKHPVDPASNVVLTDWMPAGTTFVTATLPHTFDGEAVRWVFPSLEAGGSRSVELVVRVPVTAAGTIENLGYGAASDEAVSPAGEPVVTPVKPLYGFKLSPGNAGLAWPWKSITYTHSLTNDGILPDTYDLAFSSARGWSTLDAPTSLSLAPGESAAINVSATVPEGTVLGEMDTAQLTVVSRGKPDQITTVTDTTTAGYGVHFPLFFKLGMGF